MHGFVDNIEKITLDNNEFRKVLYTAKNSQLVIMSLKPKEEIGEEVHHLDQFLRIEQGMGVAVLDGVSHQVVDGMAIMVPAGTRHNVINTSDMRPMKLYTLYSPPEHKDHTEHLTKQQAEADTQDHFDGKTTE